MLRSVLVVSLLANVIVSRPSPADAVWDGDDDPDRYRVPDGVLWGAGGSALQTEGAWNADGKAESAADRVIFKLHSEGKVFTSTHEVAADSYHRFMDDVDMAAKLKLKLYKFSMSWARVLPEADATKPNPAGVKFYHNLINAIVAKGMKVAVTMYHFDHPQILEDQFTGWQSPKMVDKFAEYSKFVFEEFGDKVDFFVTINEPNMYCTYFNMQSVAAGFHTLAELDAYQCLHYNILGHKAAYKIYQEGRARGKYKGKIGYSNLLMLASPATETPEDIYAADMMNQLNSGLSLNPVVFGDYPQAIKSLVGDKLMKFTDSEKAELVGRFMNSSRDGMESVLLGPPSQDLPFVDVTLGDPLATFTTIDPSVIKNALIWAWQSYGKPILITENGYGDIVGMGLHDTSRAAFHSATLRSLVTTVKDYKVQVLGYCVWSLVDAFEFSAGYERSFGLVHVDYEGKTLDRHLKDSSKFWIELGDTNVVPYVENPDDAVTTTVAPTTSSTSAPSNASSSVATILPLAILASLVMALSV